MNSGFDFGAFFLGLFFIGCPWIFARPYWPTSMISGGLVWPALIFVFVFIGCARALWGVVDALDLDVEAARARLDLRLGPHRGASGEQPMCHGIAGTFRFEDSVRLSGSGPWDMCQPAVCTEPSP